jgi:hypothetical protein
MDGNVCICCYRYTDNSSSAWLPDGRAVAAADNTRAATVNTDAPTEFGASWLST